MKNRNVFCCVLLFACIILFTPYFFAQTLPPAPKGLQIEIVNGNAAAPKEVLVKFRVPLTAKQINDLKVQHDLNKANRIGGVAQLYRLRSNSKSARQLLQDLASRSDVAYVQPNLLRQAIATPNEQQFPLLWGLQNTGQSSSGFDAGVSGADINAVSAWDISTGSRDNVVAIVDTGVDYTHPDLTANLWSAPHDFTVNIGGINVTCPAGSHGFNAIAFSQSEPQYKDLCDPMDDMFHGTHVAGTIGATGNNNYGVVGVNWTASIMAAKFLDANGAGWDSDAVNAIEFAIQAKAVLGVDANIRVLSNSWGGYGFDQALLDEINRAASSDMLFVAAAGNASLNDDVAEFYPASFNTSNEITVAATDNKDELAWFSNYGPNTVHLGAPGVQVYSTYPGGGYSYLNGTSMATPHVSGAALLVLSQCAMTTDALKANLLSNVDRVHALAGMTTTGGRLSVGNSIAICNSMTAGLQPSSLAFANENVGHTSSPKMVTFYNYGPVPLQLTNIAATGDFSQTNDCGTSVPAKSHCTISVVFNATAVGLSTGKVTVTYGAGDELSTSLSAGGVKLPDFVESGLAFTGMPGTGASIQVSETVLNQGAEDAPNSITEFYLSSSPSKIRATGIGSRSVPALSAGDSSRDTTSVTIPVAALLGSQYLLACANDSNVFEEMDKTNNCTAVPIQVSGPDLAETSMNVLTTNAAAGGVISVSDTVTNKGPGAASSSSTYFYLSLDGKSLGTILGSRNVPVIAPGTSSGPVNSSLTLPMGIVGPYYVIACADGDYSLAEKDDTNNCKSSAPFPVAPSDLTQRVDNVTGTLAAGGTISVADTVTNIVAAAPASATWFYLGSSATATSGSYLGSRDVASLTTASSDSAVTPLTLPLGISGTYYIVACANAPYAFPEATHSNNCGSFAIAVVGADLGENSVKVTGTPASGGTISVTDTVADAVAPSPATSTRFYFATSATATSGTYLGSRSIPSLMVGKSDTATTPLDLPVGISGSYYVVACANGNFDFIEPRANNCASAAINVAGADLSETAVSASGSLIAGGAMSVTDTVTDAVGVAPATSTWFYLATSAKATSGTYLGSRNAPSLAVGSSDTATTPLMLPNSISGSYYVVACANAAFAFTEPRTNNCASSLITVAGADLSETAVLVSGSFVSGGTISVTDTVTDAVAIAPATSTRFYLAKSAGATSGTLLGSRAVPSLTVGSSDTATTPLMLPSGISGSYYVVACANAALAFTEPRGNNCLSYAVTVTRAALNTADTNLWASTGEIPVANSAGKLTNISAVSSRYNLTVSASGGAKAYRESRTVLSPLADKGISVEALLPGPVTLASTCCLVACANPRGALPERRRA